MTAVVVSGCMLAIAKTALLTAQRCAEAAQAVVPSTLMLALAEDATVTRKVALMIKDLKKVSDPSASVDAVVAYSPSADN